MDTARGPAMVKGLHNFCKYINQFHDTSKMTILEIGSYLGDSTVIFAQYFKEVISVDPYLDDLFDKKLKDQKASIVEERFKKRIENLPVIKIKMKSLDYAKINKDVIDIIYIDGKHDYKSVKEDIQAWYKHCKYYISGHDYWRKKFPGVIRAVNETIGKPDQTFGDFSWIKGVKHE
jgi:hypothetical protein